MNKTKRGHWYALHVQRYGTSWRQTVKAVALVIVELHESEDIRQAVSWLVRLFVS